MATVRMSEKLRNDVLGNIIHPFDIEARQVLEQRGPVGETAAEQFEIARAALDLWKETYEVEATALYTMPANWARALRPNTAYFTYRMRAADIDQPEDKVEYFRLWTSDRPYQQLDAAGLRVGPDFSSPSREDTTRSAIVTLPSDHPLVARTKRNNMFQRKLQDIESRKKQALAAAEAAMSVSTLKAALTKLPHLWDLLPQWARDQHNAVEPTRERAVKQAAEPVEIDADAFRRAIAISKINTGG